MAVLILSSPEDNHAAAVSAQLAEMQVPFAYFQPADVLLDWKLNWRLDADALRSSFRQRSGEAAEIRLSDFQSFWLRRPASVKSPPMPEPWVEEFISWETGRAVDGMLYFLPGLWVNNPEKERSSLLKLNQLQRAQVCGFRVPETLVTNNPEEARAFYQAHSGKVIYKTIDERSISSMPMHEIPRGIPTTPVRAFDLEHLDQVSTCAHLFQRRIDKEADIRVTIVGNKIFAAKILSQQGLGKTDFRLDFSVPMEVYDLPEPIAVACLNLMRSLELNFGAIDLALATDGSHYFFEINPAGQWLWIELTLKLPISRTVAELLCGHLSPMSP